MGGGAIDIQVIQPYLNQEGGHIIPTQYYVPLQIFRPCDDPKASIK